MKATLGLALGSLLLVGVGVGGTLGFQALADDDDRSECEWLINGVESRSRPVTPPAGDEELHDAQLRQDFFDNLVFQLCQ